MIRLLVLGGATITDDSNGGATMVAPRQTVALLAVLAIAGQAGLSRDKLVSIFWPDTESERARHALTQAMYSARRSLRCDDLFEAGADIRLNDARIATDISDFERLTAAGSFDDAVALYRGPFLDGLFMSAAPEFERWVSAQRARIEDELATTLRRIGAEARETDDHRRAVAALKRLAAIRPLDSGVAVSLMEALAASGDRAGALQYASVHRALLLQELEIEPDPSVAELVRRLRDDAAESPAASEMSARPARITPSEPIELEITAAPSPTPRSAMRARLWRLWRPVVAATVLVAAGFAMGRTRQADRPARAVALPQRLVVAPFRVAGTSESLHYLRDGLVELLSTRLADDSTSRSVDPGAVLSAWRNAGLSATSNVGRDTVVRIATKLGAERVIIGSVVGTPSQLIVSATLLRVPSGAVAGEATIEGSADSIASIVDRLAAKLLVAEAGEDERLAVQTTNSLPALRAFLAGQAEFRRNNYTGALREYARALTRDSSFALAGLRLAVAADRIDDAPKMQRGLAVAWRNRDALSVRDRALLAALAGDRYPAPSRAATQLDEWQRVVDLSPASAEAWFTLGTRLLQDGAIVGVPSPERRSQTAFERALAADPDYVPAARQLTLLAARDASATRTSVADASIGLRDSLSPFAPFLRWRVAIARNDARTLRTIRAGLDGYGPANLRQIVKASQFDAVGSADADQALRALRTRPLATAEQSDLVFAEHSVALNRGQISEALEATERLRALIPGSHAYLRLRILDGLYGDGDSTAASDAAMELASITSAGRSGMPSTIDSWLGDLCVLTQWRLAHGDTTAANRAITELRAAPLADQTMPVVAAPDACADLLEATLAVTLRRRDAKAMLANIDDLAFTPPVAGDAATYAPLLISRLHEQLGNQRGALAAVRRRGYMSGWPRYLATMLREEGRLAEIALDTEGAREANRRFAALRLTEPAGNQ